MSDKKNPCPFFLFPISSVLRWLVSALFYLDTVTLRVSTRFHVSPVISLSRLRLRLPPHSPSFLVLSFFSTSAPASSSSFLLRLRFFLFHLQFLHLPPAEMTRAARPLSSSSSFLRFFLWSRTIKQPPVQPIIHLVSLRWPQAEVPLYASTNFRTNFPVRCLVLDCAEVAPSSFWTYILSGKCELCPRGPGAVARVCVSRVRVRVYTCMRVAPQTRLFPHSIRGSISPLSLSRARALDRRHTRVW